jgi:tetratricopeptide (TPR) repeat protein/uncharacterized RDD family membrane protein YckC
MLVDQVVFFGVPLVAFGVIAGLGLTDEKGDPTGFGLVIFIPACGFALAVGIWNRILRDGKTGQSLGRQLTGTRLIGFATGAPIGLGKVLLRQLCHLLDNLPCVCLPLGFLWPLWDQRRQTFADKIVGSIVVREGMATPAKDGDEKVASTALSVRSIRFDTSGWKEKQASNDALEWRNADGDVLRVRFSAQPASFLSDPSDLGSLREHYRREAAASRGAIVLVETVSIQGIPCIEAIKKFERLPAYAYEGVLVLAFEASHFILTLESLERGKTGMREAVLTAHLAERGELEIREEPGTGATVIKGWFLDPYLEGYQGPVLRSLSDDERLDALFPLHPLSKIRSVLRRIKKTLSFDPTLRSSKLPGSGAASIATQDVEKSRPDRARRPLASATVGALFAKGGRAEEAMAILEESVQEAESAQGGPSPELADAAMELGRLHLIQGDAGKAQAPLRRAAGLREQLGRSRDLAEALLLLAFACESQADLGEAEAALRKARVAVDKSGPEDRLRGQVILNLGRICVSQHKVAEAEPLFKEALRLFEKEDPLQSSNAAVALNGLGLVHNELGKYSAAIPLFEKALSSFQAVHGPDFPDVATVLRNMAFSWQKLGDEQKARELLQRAARVTKQ